MRGGRSRRAGIRGKGRGVPAGSRRPVCVPCPGFYPYNRTACASFAALLAIELPWALARATDTPGWNIAAEAAYFAYYAYQLMAATKTGAGVIGVGLVCAGFAAALSAMAISAAPFYETGRPSYFAYLLFDASMIVAFRRLRSRSAGTWRTVFAGLAMTSAVVFAVDVLDWLSYEEILNLKAGMPTDILWTLPPLCYALVARLGRSNHLGGAVFEVHAR